MCRCWRWPRQGLIVNFISIKLLAAGLKESRNVKGAYFEVLGDMLGSLGLLVAAGIIIFIGWKLADPLIGAGIWLLILPRAWTLLKQTIHLLMEARSRSRMPIAPRPRTLARCSLVCHAGPKTLCTTGLCG